MGIRWDDAAPEPVTQKPSPGISAYVIIDDAITQLREARKILSGHRNADAVPRLSRLIASLIRLRDNI